MIKWICGGVFKANAEKVYTEINSLGNSYTPEQVVELAKDKNTELHKCFEWNDKKAAHLYRISTAKKIIQSIVIVDESKPKDEQTHIRAIVSTNNNDRHYEPIILTVKNQDSYEKLLKQALAELEMFKNKYKNLSELEKVFEDIEAILSVA